jgi:hypothetical protein
MSTICSSKLEDGALHDMKFDDGWFRFLRSFFVELSRSIQWRNAFKRCLFIRICVFFLTIGNNRVGNCANRFNSDFGRRRSGSDSSIGNR